MASLRELDQPGALVVANPLPEDEQLDRALHDRVLTDGLEMARQTGIHGKAVTPFLLAHFHEATQDESLRVNVRIILRNAELAGRIARIWCAHVGSHGAEIG
jgi:pseudouridylate synthase